MPNSEPQFLIEPDINNGNGNYAWTVCSRKVLIYNPRWGYFVPTTSGDDKPVPDSKANEILRLMAGALAAAEEVER